MRCGEFDVDEAVELFMLAEAARFLTTDPPDDIKHYTSENEIDEQGIKDNIREHGLKAIEYYQHVRTCSRHYNELVHNLVCSGKIKEDEFDNVLEGMRNIERVVNPNFPRRT